MQSEEKIQLVAQQILRYLAENPDAGDTVEGIHQWWLGESPAMEETLTVKQALDRLVEEQWMMVVHGADNRVHYHLRRDRRARIQQLFPPEQER